MLGGDLALPSLRFVHNRRRECKIHGDRLGNSSAQKKQKLDKITTTRSERGGSSAPRWLDGHRRNTKQSVREQNRATQPTRFAQRRDNSTHLSYQARGQAGYRRDEFWETQWCLVAGQACASQDASCWQSPCELVGEGALARPPELDAVSNTGDCVPLSPKNT